MAGRPSKYNEKLGAQILREYSKGKTILQITKLKGMPSRATIYLWRSAVPEFGRAYVVAVEAHVEALVDDALNIVDTELDAKRAKVRSDFRSWLAAKLNRSKYGDKLDIDITKTLDITPALADALKRMKEIEAPAKKVLDVPCEIIAETSKV